MTNADIEDIETIQSRGLKATVPRREVLRLFRQSPRRHLCANDVFRMTAMAQRGVSLPSVYRVLLQFSETGLLLRHSFEPTRTVYELNDGHEHDHLVCLCCGCVEEFCDARLAEQRQTIARANGFELTGHRFTIFGRCSLAGCRSAAGRRRG